MKIRVMRVDAASHEQAVEQALTRVRGLVPAKGYRISDAEPKALKT